MLNERVPLGAATYPARLLVRRYSLACADTGWPQKFTRGRKLAFDRATRAVRALSDQQSARSTLPLAFMCAQDRLGFLSRFWFA